MSFIPNEFLVNVSRGKVVGAEPFDGFGRRATAGAEANVLWPDGAWVNPVSTGVQLSVVSTSASDGVGGTGIRSLELHYLDANLAPQSEILILNGTTPVLTAATNIRFMQCMHMDTFGSTKAAVGTITASNGGNTHSQVSVQRVRCESSMRMVPAGKRLFVTSFSAGSISGTAAASTIISLASSKFGDHDYTADSAFIPLGSFGMQDTTATITIPVPLVFEEGVIFGMTFVTDKAAIVVGTWFGWLENA